MISSAILTIYAGAAALQDLKSDRIRNAFVAAFLVPGLLLSACTGGVRGFFLSLGCVGLAFLLLFPVYLIGGLGAGDVKLLMGAAAYLRYGELLMLIGLSFLCAAVIGIVRLLYLRKLHGTLHFAVAVFFGVLLLFGKTLPVR